MLPEVIGIGVGVAALAGIGIIASYNRLIALGQRCDQAFADCDVQMRHRHDLIPSLVETVKGFAAHERGLFDSLMQARASAMREADPERRLSAEAALTTRLGHVMAIVETYPEAHGSRHFAELRHEIADCENKIAAARRFLNMAVSEHNATLGQFPGNLLGRRFGMDNRRYFDLGIERAFVEEAPSVKF